MMPVSRDELMIRSGAGSVVLSFAVLLSACASDPVIQAQPEPGYVTKWNAACLEEYDRDMASIRPVEADLTEPERPEIPIPAVADNDTPVDVPIVETEEPIKGDLMEGMRGPFSPLAVEYRESQRRQKAANDEFRQRTTARRDACLAHPPVALVEGVCPFIDYGPYYLTLFEDETAGEICYPQRVPPPPPAPMSTWRAFQNSFLRPIRVAFNGGSPAVRQEIRSIAQDWADATNAEVGPTAQWMFPHDPHNLKGALNFDFGTETPDGFEFHTWSRDDETYAADIRIAFEDGMGFWSMIGTDATKSWLAAPGAASMNLEGLHGYAPMPKDWRAVVYHEFGHALGLHHEHQHPTSDCGNALRLEDDLGYQLTLDAGDRAVADEDGRRPGVLTLLQHAPNHWSRRDAEFNMQQLRKTRKLAVMEFDPKSIMLYEFAPEWYRDDAPAECLPTGVRATEPSELDYKMVAQTYQEIMQSWLDTPWGQ